MFATTIVKQSYYKQAFKYDDSSILELNESSYRSNKTINSMSCLICNKEKHNNNKQ